MAKRYKVFCDWKSYKVFKNEMRFNKNDNLWKCTVGVTFIKYKKNSGLMKMLTYYYV